MNSCVHTRLHTEDNNTSTSQHPVWPSQNLSLPTWGHHGLAVVLIVLAVVAFKHICLPTQYIIYFI